MEVHFMFLFVCMIACVKYNVQAEGSCKEANLCCDGRDSTCIVQKANVALNSVLHHTDHHNEHRQDYGDERPCYCDHACLAVGDCCYDFQETCGAVDCDISAWDDWSACSSECGIGTMTRERRIVRSPSNGGKPCPELMQKRSCYGTRCDGKTYAKANRETAMILPATYSTIRHMNATQDIRNNLRLRYRKDPEEEGSKEYCVVFEITKARKSCENLGTDVSPKFEKGSKVCTVCENAAMRKYLGYRCQGHGVVTKTTRFTLLAFPQCHGRWQRLEVTEKCECNEEGKPDFIFV